MNRERAERILHTLREFGVVDVMGIPLEEGITLWYIPAGNAAWSTSDACHGSLYFGYNLTAITYWPKPHIYALCDGQGDRNPIPYHARHHLWNQELYVYILERDTALKRAIQKLDELFPIPRLPGHPVDDIDPYPEDFGSGVTKKVNQICIEAIEGWLRSVPNEIAA